MICTTCGVTHDRTYAGAIVVECWGNARCWNWAGPSPRPDVDHFLMSAARRAARKEECPDGSATWHAERATPERVVDIHARMIEAHELSLKRWDALPALETDGRTVAIMETDEAFVRRRCTWAGVAASGAIAFEWRGDVSHATDWSTAAQFLRENGVR